MGALRWAQRFVGLGTLRNRLALVFLGITLTALLAVYLYVVPPLESTLRDEKLRGLANTARTSSGRLVRAIGSNVSETGVDQAVRLAADSANARVTLLGVSRGTQGLETYPISDSTAEVSLEDLAFPTALEAAATRRTVTCTEPSNTGRVGEAALPLFFNGRVARVVVYSAPLADVQSNVSAIRRRIVIAGAIALLLAVLAGYYLAGALSRRVKRLEEAAEKVAAGDFSQPIPVDSEDELGQLAIAFNEMQRQLSRLDSARKSFIATASHELRTPLFSLGGFVELLQDESLDEPTRQQFLEQIRQQIERLGKLATDLLDLSKLEAGSLELHARTADLAELARTVTDEFTPALARHGSRLQLNVEQEAISARCDPERVAQIIRILIDNAIAHTPEGTDVFVSARRYNGSVQIAVRDRGLGIKHDALAQIFEPFFTSNDVQGAGLGLAIARELAEHMSGRLDVRSSPGNTTFTLELPA